MTDMWRLAKTIMAAIVAAFAGLHMMIQMLVWAIGFDILTGVLAAFCEGKVSSEVSRRGIARKVLLLIGVACAELLGRSLGIEVTTPWGATWGIGAAVAAYYLIHEGISITENLSRAGVPVPLWVRQRLERLRAAAEQEEA